ncbi:MAG: hydrolase [Lutispora sp.]|jgi:nicotinamidase-related amidase
MNDIQKNMFSCIGERRNTVDKYYLNKEEAILLIIDIQEKLAPAINQGDSVIKNTNVLVAAAKNMDIPIIVTEQYPKGLGPTVPEIEENLEGVEKFDKITFTACTEGVIESLNKTGRKKVIITGMETHICVFQTTRDLLNQGYDVFIAADGVSSRTEENKSNGLELMRDMGAVISNTETILYDLLKVSGTPQFKALSKLIK